MCTSICLLLLFPSESTATPFLDTEGGVVYIPVFRSLRVQNILTDCASVNILESDGIVPQSKPHLFQ